MDTKSILRLIRVGFFILIGSLFYLQIIKGDYFYQKAKNNYIRIVPQEAIRGAIFSADGERLAYDRAMFNIAVIPYQIKNTKDCLFKEIADFLNIKKEKLIKNYQKNWRGYFLPVNILTNVRKEEALRIKEKFGDKIFINISSLRFYPYSYAFSHILGYVKEAKVFYKDLKKYGYSRWERVGVRGVEKVYNDYLRGENGVTLLEVNSQGKITGFLGKTFPRKGKDIYLTIDARMQKIAYKVLGGKRGAIILMSPYSGRIFVCVSSPSFNLSDFIQGKNIRRFIKDSRFPLINRATSARYSPGSIFKPIVGIAGLEERLIDTSTYFNCSGRFRLGERTFSCWGIHGRENIIEAIKHSCNIYFYNLGLKLGVDKISFWARQFGLDKPTGIDIPSEKKGLIPSRSWKKRYRKGSWRAGDTLNFSIGQGYIEITPLEATVAISVFANGGYLVTPYLVEKIEEEGFPHQGERKLYLSPENIEIIRKGMIKAVEDEDGTAHFLKKLNLKIAGKTGTAQNPMGKPHGWFVGFFPYGRPRYSICVFLENGGSSFNALVVAYKFLLRLKEENLL